MKGKFTVIGFEEYREWDFNKPTMSIDLGEFVDKVDGMGILEGMQYLDQVRRNAPLLYGLLSVWAKCNNALTWWEFVQKDSLPVKVLNNNEVIAAFKSSEDAYMFKQSKDGCVDDTVSLKQIIDSNHITLMNKRGG